MGGTPVTDGVITGGIIRMLGMADGVVKAILIMGGTMAFTEEGFVATHIMAMALIMGGTTVDTMVEINGEMGLITTDTIMAGTETEAFVMRIMEEVILMEG
jgi:hypothetical protein